MAITKKLQLLIVKLKVLLNLIMSNQIVSDPLLLKILQKRFASLNDKRFYFMGGIVSLPFGHKFLEPARNLKSQFRSEITTKFIDQLYEFINSEQSALSCCERLRIFQTT